MGSRQSAPEINIGSSAESVGELAPSRAGMKKKPSLEEESAPFLSRSGATVDLDSASTLSPTVRKGRHLCSLASVGSLGQPTDSAEEAKICIFLPIIRL